MIQNFNIIPDIIGRWQGKTEPATGETAIHNAISNVCEPVYLINKNGAYGVSQEGALVISKSAESEDDGYPALAYAPALHPKNLGDKQFKETYGISYAYVCGAMANGITSVEMVEAAGKAGMLGFFGAGGLSLDRIEAAIIQLKKTMGDHPFGFNLIHSPSDPAHETATVQLYLDHGVNLISASAYLALTLPLVYYRVKGIYADPQGNIICPNKVIAKISRIEVAQKFLSPPPDKMLAQLVSNNYITQQEADLAKRVPVAEDVTAEADSGGHTDNRPAMGLLPTIIALRNELADQYQYERIPCIGLGGGISTPYSTAAAFAMGAAYVLTGSVNQACVESGTSETVRHMLIQARQADVAMAPAADMFEMGAKVQVLKRGTMFPLRASKLYDLYNRYDKYEDIPQAQQEQLEKDFFKHSFFEEWESTKQFFATVDPKQIQRAEKDPKHQMALVFRSYLGQSSMWSVNGIPDRQMDFQIWCGPAMGAFNQWAKGSFFDDPANRKTVTVALNLLLGAATITRLNWLKHQGAVFSNQIGRFVPLAGEQIAAIIGT